MTNHSWTIRLAAKSGRVTGLLAGIATIASLGAAAPSAAAPIALMRDAMSAVVQGDVAVLKVNDSWRRNRPDRGSDPGTGRSGGFQRDGGGGFDRGDDGYAGGARPADPGRADADADAGNARAPYQRVPAGPRNGGGYDGSSGSGYAGDGGGYDVVPDEGGSRRAGDAGSNRRPQDDGSPYGVVPPARDGDGYATAPAPQFPNGPYDTVPGRPYDRVPDVGPDNNGYALAPVPRNNTGVYGAAPPSVNGDRGLEYGALRPERPQLRRNDAVRSGLNRLPARPNWPYQNLPANAGGDPNGPYQNLPANAGGDPNGPYQNLPANAGGDPNGPYRNLPANAGGDPNGPYQNLPANAGGDPNGPYQNLPANAGGDPNGPYRNLPANAGNGTVGNRVYDAPPAALDQRQYRQPGIEIGQYAQGQQYGTLNLRPQVPPGIRPVYAPQPQYQRPNLPNDATYQDGALARQQGADQGQYGDLNLLPRAPAGLRPVYGAQPQYQRPAVGNDPNYQDARLNPYQPIDTVGPVYQRPNLPADPNYRDAALAGNDRRGREGGEPVDRNANRPLGYEPVPVGQRGEFRAPYGDVNQQREFRAPYGDLANAGGDPNGQDRNPVDEAPRGQPPGYDNPPSFWNRP